MPPTHTHMRALAHYRALFLSLSDLRSLFLSLSLSRPDHRCKHSSAVGGDDADAVVEPDTWLRKRTTGCSSVQAHGSKLGTFQRQRWPNASLATPAIVCAGAPVHVGAHVTQTSSPPVCSGGGGGGGGENEFAADLAGVISVLAGNFALVPLAPEDGAADSVGEALAAPSSHCVLGRRNATTAS